MDDPIPRFMSESHTQDINEPIQLLKVGDKVRFGRDAEGVVEAVIQDEVIVRLTLNKPVEHINVSVDALRLREEKV